MHLPRAGPTRRDRARHTGQLIVLDGGGTMIGVRDMTGVVVTGAGHGIGRAIAVRLAAGGARVVVNDVDAAAAELVAKEVGGLAAPGDAAGEDGVAALVERARAHLGEIEVWFANAGIERGGGLDADETDWAASLEVNVLAHVRAARLLVPRWLERGSGRFVVTASAAGLLTSLGSPAYAVSKHAAVAFAEWLSATYRHRGVVVQAICPQGVRTRMFDAAGALQALVAHDRVLEPEEVADAVWQALQDDRFLVLPHPEVARYYAGRAADTDRWLAGMNKVQRRLEAEEVAP
jgi:NAD(P)-dependent dehydrogenase (short-subunit alcohol dehydrogenase family)